MPSGALELMGLLEPRQGIGTVVCSPDAAKPANPLATALLEKRKMVAELIDVRKMIEPPLAARAALHVSRDAIADMEDILVRQEAKVLQGGNLGIEEDSEFHYSHRLWPRTTPRDLESGGTC
jgi:GntR family transcriptional repressor for pyruvate dehydrogenase complex